MFDENRGFLEGSSWGFSDFMRWRFLTIFLSLSVLCSYIIFSLIATLSLLFIFFFFFLPLCVVVVGEKSGFKEKLSLYLTLLYGVEFFFFYFCYIVLALISEVVRLSLTFFWFLLYVLVEEKRGYWDIWVSVLFFTFFFVWSCQIKLYFLCVRSTKLFYYYSAIFRSSCTILFLILQVTVS